MHNFCQYKMASSALTRWTWDDEKTDAFLLAVRKYKCQKGMEWDSEIVLSLEHIQKSLGEKWETDFGKAEPLSPMKPLAEMTKDKYLCYLQEVKEEKKVISKGLTRVKNKYKGNY